jgi:hypothetical protein
MAYECGSLQTRSSMIEAALNLVASGAIVNLRLLLLAAVALPQ